MTETTTRSLLRQLGISQTYGREPYRPAYREASALVDVEMNILGQMQRLTPHTATAWLAMKQAARADGVALLIVSGYRSIAYQAEIFERKLATGLALEEILEVNAAPGFSQHHTGEAVDIATPGARPLTEEFETTAAFAWLGQHAPGFDFRMPYHRGNSSGFAYEPWHWTRLRA
jgi:D-alanyl-D-alanine carboxypeptidase